MNVRGMPLGPLQANCYLLVHEEDAVVVDPGGDPEAILRHLEEEGLRLREVWLTHAHFDHVGGLAGLVMSAEEPVPVRMHPADLPLLERAAASAASWGIEIPAPPTSTEPLAHGEILRFGDDEARCLHTPGHAPGHVAFWMPRTGVVLSGDALFRGSIGRTDLPFGDQPTLIASIRGHLLTLPPDTTVLPGHGPATTIAAEARGNPFLA